MFVLLLLTLVLAVAIPLVVIADVAPAARVVAFRARPSRVAPALRALVSSLHLPRPPRA